MMFFLRYSKIDQENLMELVSQWQESYPKDNFDFMPATSNENQPMDEDNINDVQCVEQDDEDEVFSQLITTTTNQSSRGICFIGNVLYVRLSCIIIGEFFCNVDMSYITVSIWYVVPFLLSFDIKQIDVLFHFVLKKF